MYAKVKKSLPEMYAFSVCMWLKSSAAPGVGTPFSYAVPGQANELVLIEWGNNPMEILINDKVTPPAVWTRRTAERAPQAPAPRCRGRSAAGPPQQSPSDRGGKGEEGRPHPHSLNSVKLELSQTEASRGGGWHRLTQGVLPPSHRTPAPPPPARLRTGFAPCMGRTADALGW